MQPVLILQQSPLNPKTNHGNQQHHAAWKGFFEKPLADENLPLMEKHFENGLFTSRLTGEFEHIPTHQNVPKEQDVKNVSRAKWMQRNIKNALYYYETQTMSKF